MLSEYYLDPIKGYKYIGERCSWDKNGYFNCLSDLKCGSAYNNPNEIAENGSRAWLPLHRKPSNRAHMLSEYYLDHIKGYKYIREGFSCGKNGISPV